jgi:hypothetical protein
VWNGKDPDGGLDCFGWINGARIFHYSFDSTISWPLQRPQYSPTGNDLYNKFSGLVDQYKGTIEKFCSTSTDHEEFVKTYFMTDYDSDQVGWTVFEGEPPRLPLAKVSALREKENELMHMFDDYYPPGGALVPGGVGHWYLFRMLHRANVLRERVK